MNTITDILLLDQPAIAENDARLLRSEDYWAYLDEMDLSDDDRAAILEALWSIMVAFVDLGFGVDPVQQILPALVAGSLRESGNPPVARERFAAAVNSEGK